MTCRYVVTDYRACKVFARVSLYIYAYTYVHDVGVSVGGLRPLHMSWTNMYVCAQVISVRFF